MKDEALKIVHSIIDKNKTFENLFNKIAIENDLHNLHDTVKNCINEIAYLCNNENDLAEAVLKTIEDLSKYQQPFKKYEELFEEAEKTF